MYFLPNTMPSNDISRGSTRERGDVPLSASLRILFLHSGSEVTGSWTYARALEQAWRNRHTVFWINDGLDGASPPSLRLPLKKKLFPHGFWNAARIATFVRWNQVSLIHSHCRRSHMAAAMASRFTGVPHVATVHQRMKPHFFNRLWPCFGDRTIAICENVRDPLASIHGVPVQRMSLIRNGINTDFFSPRPFDPAEGRWITILGRISGHRWRAVVFLLSIMEDILRAYPDVRIRFVGAVDPKRRLEFHGMIARLNGRMGSSRVLETGFMADVRPLLAQSTVVIAAGRSLLESLSMERPVIAVGEECSLGLIRPDNFALAQRTNFGDFNGHTQGQISYDPVSMRQDIQSILNRRVDVSRLSHWGREQVIAHYNNERVADDVLSLYARVLS